MLRHFELVFLYFRVFGFKPRFLVFPLIRCLLRSYIEITLLLDRIFYPGFCKYQPDKPVFIIGHPRSGTTFLHRFIIKNNESNAGLKLWDMIIPSVTGRKILAPLYRKLKRKSGKSLYDPKIHKTDLFSEETDDAAIFFRYFGGLFHWLFVKAWKRFDSTEELEQSLIRSATGKRYVKYLKRVYARKFYKERKQIVSKSFSLVMSIESIRKEFPDARIIAMVRDPKEAIPSSMSLESSIQNKLNGFNNLADQRKKEYFDILYKASVLFYKSLYNETVKDPSLLVVHYSDLKGDFRKTMARIVAYCGIDVCREFESMIEKQHNLQKNYKGEHQYKLEDYWLDAKRIEDDLWESYYNHVQSGSV